MSSKKPQRRTPPTAILDEPTNCADCGALLEHGSEGKWYGNKFYGRYCHRTNTNRLPSGTVRQTTGAGIRPAKKRKPYKHRI